MTTSLPTSAEVAATVPLLERFDGLAVPLELSTLAARLRVDRSGIALVGLINRGKSTLVNRLCGVAVSAVSATPETAALIGIMTGAPAAWGWTPDGGRHELPSDPADFLRAARRTGGLGVSGAELRGRFRLPLGLRLIDTPGVDDAAEDEALLARLADDWRFSGAGAAVVVLGYPPKLSAREEALTRRVCATFPNRTVVVQKASTRGISTRDLEILRDYASDTLGQKVLLLPDDAPSGPWGDGSGPLFDLESALDVLAERLDASLQKAIGRYGQLVNQTVERLATSSGDGLAMMQAALMSASGAANPRLVHALRSSISHAETLQSAADRDALRSTRREVINESATRILRLADGASVVGRSVETKRFAAELIEMANGGSDVARSGLVELLGQPKRSAAWGVTAATIIKSLEDDIVNEVAPRLVVDAHEAKAVLAVCRKNCRAAIEHRLLSLAEKAADDEFPSVLVRHAGLQSTRAAATVLVGRRIVASVTSVQPKNATLKQLVAAADHETRRFDAWRNDANSHGVDPAAMSEVATAFTGYIRSIARRCSPRIEQALATLFETPVLDHEKWTRKLHWLLGLERWIEAVVPSNATDRARGLVHFGVNHGEAWSRESNRRYLEAVARTAQLQQNWRNIYLSSLTILGLGLLWLLVLDFFLISGGTRSRWLCFGSFLVAVFARKVKNAHDDWPALYRHPEPVPEFANMETPPSWISDLLKSVKDEAERLMNRYRAAGGGGEVQVPD